MIITLTSAQAAEIANPFWDIDLGVDDEGRPLGIYSDDLVQEIPLLATVADQLPTTDDGGVWFEHVSLTEADAILIRWVLDWRAAQMATVAALPADQRAAARSAIRSGLRTAARQQARRSERVAFRVAARTAERVEDRVTARIEARRQWREQVTADAVAAGVALP